MPKLRRSRCPHLANFVPMSAVRIKASMAAEQGKQRRQRKEQRAKQAKPECWKGIFDDPDARDMDEGSQQDALWVAEGSHGRDAEVKNFLEEDGWKGRRPGWTFKTGAYGLGYYREGSAEAYAGAPSPKVEMGRANLELSELLARKSPKCICQ